MKLHEAYSKGFRDCSKIYRGKWGYILSILLLTFGVLLGIIISFWIY